MACLTKQILWQIQNFIQIGFFLFILSLVTERKYHLNDFPLVHLNEFLSPGQVRKRDLIMFE